MIKTALPRRRSLLVGSMALATGLGAPFNGPTARQTHGPWAVELFTSQGCSSCPPADAFLGKLAQRPDVVALSFHVTYWDYIGWKDRFASPEFTERQRTYARMLKQRSVYTPEMVVEGAAHAPGIDPGPIEAMLAEAKRRAASRATPQLTRASDGSLEVKLAAFSLDRPAAEVVLVVYDRRHSTAVPRGENTGRTLGNFNVVRRLETIAERWSGAAASWTVPADRFAPDQGLAVLVQAVDCGPILGCNKLEAMAAG